MRLQIVDADASVALAFQAAFHRFPEVRVAHGDLLDAAGNAVVSPANAHGFMDGGIDAKFRSFFGAGIETKVREAIGQRAEGCLSPQPC